MKKKLDFPLISIITVVYNGEKYFEQTILSVINQTYKNIEYIIIDGGSTDGSIDIIRKYKDNISYWVSEPDNGLYDAMNKGIKIAKGELIGMINSDDWYEQDALEIMADAYQKNPEKNIFHADRYDVDEGGSKKVREFNPSTFKFKYYGMTYNHPSMFISKREYSKHIYNIDLQALSDFQFVLESFLKNKKAFLYINTPIVNFRLGGISAQMLILKRLKEGFLARKYAGMNLFENIFSFGLRFIIILVYRIKNLAINS